jgi:hypothetical protein
VRLSASRDIARAAEEVFVFISDSSNNPKWQKGQQSCVWTTTPPIGVGSSYDQEARFLGRSVRNRFEVIAYEPGRTITIRSTEGSFPIEVKRSVEPLDETSSRVTAEIRGEPGGVFRIGGALLQRLAQRSVDADYDRLKGLLESGGP